MQLKEGVCPNCTGLCNNCEELEESEKRVRKRFAKLRANHRRLIKEGRRPCAKCNQREAELKKNGCGDSTHETLINLLGDHLQGARNMLTTATVEELVLKATLHNLRTEKAELEVENQNLQQRCGRLEKQISTEAKPTTEARDLADTTQSPRAQLLTQSAKIVALEEDCRSAREENVRLEEALALEMRFVDQIKAEMLAISDQPDCPRNSKKGTREGLEIGTKREALENDAEYLLKVEEKERPSILKVEFD